VYSTEDDGYSIKFFYAKTANLYPTVLVVRTAEGNVFGAYVTAPFLEHEGHTDAVSHGLLQMDGSIPAARLRGIDASVHSSP
jgi:hypothetical protein